MGKIFYVMGKSASGKDSIFHALMQDPELGLKKIVMYTTRPMRSSEADGREYFFRDETFFEAQKACGRVIESRTYETVCGPWSYFTLDDGQFDTEKESCLMIGTLESYKKTGRYFTGKKTNRLIPIYVEVEDGQRLLRAVERERKQKEPKYKELCRRFLADAQDFSEENLKLCGIERRFRNEDLNACVQEIREMILSEQE